MDKKAGKIIKTAASKMRLPHHPVAACTHARIEDGMVTVTDGSVAVRAMNGPSSDGPALVEIAKLVKFAPDEIRREGDRAALVRSGRTLRVPTWPLDRWVEAGDLGVVRGTTRISADALALLLHSAASDDTRYYLHGAYIDAAGKAVSTDGHRLSVVEAPIEGAGGGVIVPRVALDIATAITDGDVRITLKKRGCTMSDATGSWSMDAPYINGEFPQWRRVVPPIDEGTVIELPRDDLADFVAEALRLLPGTVPVTISRSGDTALHLQARGSGDDDGADGADGADLTGVIFAAAPVRFSGVTFNARYVKELLAHAPKGGVVSMVSSGPTQPALFKLPQGDVVMMPMRAPRS